jgi:hypothetical protein
MLEFPTQGIILQFLGKWTPNSDKLLQIKKRKGSSFRIFFSAYVVLLID